MALFEIIPKITSPLAVICFALYILYLFKQRSDKTKEKTLLVGDTDTQKIAVKKILGDHPDVEIDLIRNPKAALELAKKIIDDKLKKHNKTMNTFLVFAAIFAVTFIVSLLISNINLFKKPVDPKPIISFGTWAEAEAERKNMPYALLAVVQHIKLRDVQLTDSTKERVAEFRNYYTVSALKDIEKNDHVFQEQFLSENAKVLPWPGSENQEIESVKEGSYWVKFDQKKGEVRTIVTGANYTYPIPILNGSSSSCFGDIISAPTQWMTCYPNTLDYIDNLTILIESDNLSVSLPVAVSAYKKTKENAKIETEGNCKIYARNNNCTLIAKWEKIYPGECVALKINWPSQ